MSQASDPLHVYLWVKVFLSVFFFFFKGNNQEAGFSGLVTFSNHSFESQNVSGLGFPGHVVHDLVSDTHLALEKQSAFIT